MKIYILIEQCDIEIIRIDCYNTVFKAEEVFKACCEQNHVCEEDIDQLEPELRGTLAIAGDDAYCVQLIEREI